jgi:hypothetical protein
LLALSGDAAAKEKLRGIAASALMQTEDSQIRRSSRCLGHGSNRLHHSIL